MVLRANAFLGMNEDMIIGYNFLCIFNLGCYFYYVGCNRLVKADLSTSMTYLGKSAFQGKRQITGVAEEGY